jgi:hypothetical protein
VGQFDGAAHGNVGVPKSGAHPAIPLFQRADSTHASGIRPDVEPPALHESDEARESIQPVGIDAVALVLGEKARHKLCPRLRHAMAQQDTV